jgi:malonate-semialdehyde dehydrogenase (acetylating) / methylmalonate-semialdehyde dehydrogenase
MATDTSSSVQIPTPPISVLNFCAGEYFPGEGAEIFVASPYTGKTIGTLRESTSGDLDRIVARAREPQKAWAATPLKERCQVMFKLREILLRDIDKISHRISSECGKTLTEARAEILKGVEVIEYASSLQNSDVGGKLEVSRGVHCEYRREPVGIVASITPFNFPAMVPLWTLPIAITLGNAFIWKPSDKTPLTSLLIAEACEEAGLPKGILNLVQGGRITVEAILAHPEIASIGFVGSTAVAKRIYQLGSQNLKRVLALGGAKNHILLLPDADLELTGKGVADSFTGCAGQRCMAASVLCAVQGKTSNEKIEKLISAVVDQAKKFA